MSPRHHTPHLSTLTAVMMTTVTTQRHRDHIIARPPECQHLTRSQNFRWSENIRAHLTQHLARSVISPSQGVHERDSILERECRLQLGRASLDIWELSWALVVACSTTCRLRKYTLLLIAWTFLSLLWTESGSFLVYCRKCIWLVVTYIKLPAKTLWFNGIATCRRWC